MRLLFQLPVVEPQTFIPPTVCPIATCRGTALYHHESVVKSVRDTHVTSVVAERYRCLDCQHTFRVYPPGVTQDHVSQRVQGTAVMLYLLGLSYGATSLALTALGIPYSKTRVYETVQAAARRVPGLCQRRPHGQAAALGADLTSVKVRGKAYTVAFAVNSVTGEVLSVDGLDQADAKTLSDWLQPIADAVGAQLVVTDDADAFKTATEATGLPQQVCKTHVKRNTDDLVDALTPLAAADGDGSLAALGVTPAQAVADLATLRRLVQTRQPTDAPQVAQLHERYMSTPAPPSGQAWSLAYRLRMLYLDRWNLWPALTRYRTWRGPGAPAEQVDGTNNACERAIGWWCKERYRPMRSYQVEANAVWVTRLLAHAGNHLHRGGLDLTPLVA